MIVGNTNGKRKVQNPLLLHTLKVERGKLDKTYPVFHLRRPSDALAEDVHRWYNGEASAGMKTVKVVVEMKMYGSLLDILAELVGF